MALPTKRAAVFELLLCGAIWGFGFVATKWALQGFAPFALTFWRFFLAALAGILLTTFFVKVQKKYSYDDMLDDFATAMMPGIWLGLTLAFQTYGLVYTSVTKSSFITTLYVVFVPILDGWLLKTKLSTGHFLCVLLALAGTAFLTQILNADMQLNIDSFNRGDLFTLLCTCAATLHIYSVQVRSRQVHSILDFNTGQSIWSAALALILTAFLNESWSIPQGDIKIWSGLLALTFGSTFFAFMIQVRAQKVLSASVSSLLFLLEAPFASLFAFLIMAEHFSTAQIIGAVLIFIGAGWATRLKTHHQDAEAIPAQKLD